MNNEEIRREVTKKEAPAPLVSEAELKEIQRLKFVLDRANRYPNLLSNEETLKLSRKLAELERKAHGYK